MNVELRERVEADRSQMDEMRERIVRLEAEVLVRRAAQLCCQPVARVPQHSCLLVVVDGDAPTG